jgi:hypothetical protein
MDDLLLLHLSDLLVFVQAGSQMLVVTRHHLNFALEVVSLPLVLLVLLSHAPLVLLLALLPELLLHVLEPLLRYEVCLVPEPLLIVLLLLNLLSQLPELFLVLLLHLCLLLLELLPQPLLLQPQLSFLHVCALTILSTVGRLLFNYARQVLARVSRAV